MTESVKTRTGGRSARVRRSVLDATMELLQESGVEGVTVPAVAERSGVHHTSIYRRWENRAELLRDAVIDAVEVTVPTPDTGTLRGDLQVMLEEVRSYLQAPAGQAAWALAGSKDPAIVELIASIRRTRVAQSTIIVDRARTRGEITGNFDAALFLDMLVGPLQTRARLGEQLDTIYLEAILDLGLNGILSS